MTETILYAPEEYWSLSPDALKEIVNGCGTSGWKGALVPDELLGLSITPACNIHDFMYWSGQTIEDKQIADRAFLNNMLRIIDNAGGLLSKERRLLAKGYYEAVHWFGGPAFWVDKNPAATMQAHK